MTARALATGGALQKIEQPSLTNNTDALKFVMEAHYDSFFCFETMRAVRRWHRSSKRQNVHIARQALRQELLDALGDQQQQDSVISWGLSHLTKTSMSSSWSSKCHSQMAATTKKKNGYTPGRVWWSAPAVFDVWYMDSGYETKVMRWDW